VSVEHITIRHAEDLDDAVERGPAWRPIADMGDGPHTYGDGRPLRAVVTCPRGHTLGLPHRIADDGTVRPSIVCPEKGCGWHVWGRLEGWSP
jgi:hypothetical protein